MAGRTDHHGKEEKKEEERKRQSHLFATITRLSDVIRRELVGGKKKRVAEDETPPRN